MPYINCAACNYWVKEKGQAGTEGEEIGQCRKYAPTPYHNPPPREESSKAHWPLTDEEDGCGEGEVREERARKSRSA